MLIIALEQDFNKESIPYLYKIIISVIEEIKEKETGLSVLEGDVAITIDIIKITTQPK